MSDELTPDALLAGPRGRRLCFELLRAPADIWRIAFSAERSPSEQNVNDLVDAIADAAPAPIDATLLLDALEAAVGSARYWQPPDETDVLAATPRIRAALEPVARQIVESAHSSWWSTPVQLDDLRHVQWLGDDGQLPLAPSFTGASGQLQRWRTRSLAEEAATVDRPAASNYSGSWWSTPAHTALVTSTRSAADLGALTLRLVEDALGWTEAIVTPLRATRPPHVYELTGPDAWGELVARFPMPVSRSRRQDWWRTTGVDGEWAIPDWAGVASAYDAVHLTVAGYLTTAGRALPVADDVGTVLAGWDPDQSYWLGDVLEIAGDPVHWHRDENTLGWSR